MNRWIASLVVVAVAAAVIAGAAAAAPAGPVAPQTDSPTNASDGENASAANGTPDLSPGERLSGVVGVQGAEIEGDVESRAFEVGLREAETNESRAGVVADRLNRTEKRLTELEAQQRELRERRDAGELSQGAYAARMATTTARIETLSRGLNRSVSAAAELPPSVRNETSVDDERVATLRDRANELSGPEVAAIARGVAGTGVGGPVAPEQRGPPGNGTERGPPGNGTERGPPTDAGAPGGESPGAGSGNGSVGVPGSGPGNGTTGAPGAGSANDTAGSPGAESPNWSSPVGSPGNGNATGDGADDSSTGSPVGSGNGSESDGADDSSTGSPVGSGNGSESDGGSSDGGPGDGSSGGNGSNPGADAPSVEAVAGASPAVASGLSRLNA